LDPEIVGRGGDNEINGTVGKPSHPIETVHLTKFKHARCSSVF
jgi:hypothetical protein